MAYYFLELEKAGIDGEEAEGHLVAGFSEAKNILADNSNTRFVISELVIVKQN